MSDTEATWLQQAQLGDSEAFSQLVETYQTPVFHLCYRMLGDEQEAEDAAQETFWRAYQSLKRYDPQRSFATWLLSIAAHYCIDQRRRHRVPIMSLELLPEDGAPDSAPSPEKVVGQDQEDAGIRRLLDHLAPQDKAAVIMRYWYDFSDDEIGKALSLSVSAVKSRLFRARRLLADNWTKTHPQSNQTERRQNESPAF
ncbi:MAG: RNA polymerase sigma factor [Anaerolineaceae bacterium]